MIQNLNTFPLSKNKNIINLNVILTVLFGYVLFKQKINIYGFLGIMLWLIGLFIIVKTC